MASVGVRRTILGLVAIVALAAAFLAGLRQGQLGLLKSLQIEASGNLTQRIEILSRLRMGEVPKAIDQLEREADLLTLSMAQNPGANRQVLSYMKTYLSAAPPSPERAESLAPALEGVPVLDPGKCKTALKDYLEFAKKDRAHKAK